MSATASFERDQSSAIQEAVHRCSHLLRAIRHSRGDNEIGSDLRFGPLNDYRQPMGRKGMRNRAYGHQCPDSPPTILTPVLAMALPPTSTRSEPDGQREEKQNHDRA